MIKACCESPFIPLQSLHMFFIRAVDMEVDAVVDDLADQVAEPVRYKSGEAKGALRGMYARIIIKKFVWEAREVQRLRGRGGYRIIHFIYFLRHFCFLRKLMQKLLLKEEAE